MYCIIMNYTINKVDVLELPYNDFWEESKIEEHTGYDMKDCYFMITEEKPQLNFINY